MPASSITKCEGTFTTMDRESGSRIGKRMREAEDEVYLDNYHSNKRYLTEVISSSLNGLKVGDADWSRPSVCFDLGVSPSRSETAVLSKSVPSFRSHADEVYPLDSPMSDDSEESVGCRISRAAETPHGGAFDPGLPSPTTPASPDQVISYMSPPTNRSLARSYSFSPSPYSSLTCRQRSHNTEVRLPPSPSDPCQPPDLRRAALMRALQIRALSPGGAPCNGVVSERISDARAHVKDKLALSISNTEVPVEQNDDILGSPLHGIFPSQAGRSSSSARNLLLDGKIVRPSESIFTVEEMDRGGDGPRDTSIQKRGRSSGDSLSRLKKGKLRRHSSRNYFGGVSDTDSSF